MKDILTTIILGIALIITLIFVAPLMKENKTPPEAQIESVGDNDFHEIHDVHNNNEKKISTQRF